ncbi:hypothetical protein DFJ73DRAFT_800540 [Zopfochytrium polystomum]|nr:hypothetical protein DFJ73DRAFT_800540 [Zopfochytrium polystomum]
MSPAIVCPHLAPPGAASAVRVPSLHDRVHKEECTQCFDSQDGENGVNVCLTCFNGGCMGNDDRNHSFLHYQNHKHPFVLNIRRVEKPKDESRPQKITKLAIEVESEEEKYDFIVKACCFDCGGAEIDGSPIKSAIDGVLNAMSSRKKSDVQAWQEEITACAHTSELAQGQPKSLGSHAQCKDCELQENLWLCLVCGNLGCGRQQYGGVGGNGHGVAHFEQTGHTVSCKMGTITPEGTADIFCYKCEDDRLDPHLARHLRNFGINIAEQQKTEKSLAELQLEQNLKFDFSMVTEDGKLFTPLFGPGYTGISNLGNTCYMASVVQSMFHLQEFQSLYLERGQKHIAGCRQVPADCYHCQMAKMADGICSGRYSTPVFDDEGEIRGQNGISPSMFKALLSKGHAEFSSMRQQDAQEYFQHLLKTIQKQERASGQDPSSVFQFTLEQRLQCERCRHVRYTQEKDVTSLALPVPAIKDDSGAYSAVSYENCLGSLFSEEQRTFNCPVCKDKTSLTTLTRIRQFPRVLVTPTNRFVIGANYVMEKLNVAIKAPMHLDIGIFRAPPRSSDETPFPEGADDQVKSGPAVDENAVDQLMAMGFPRNRCVRALVKTGNNGPDIAMNWLFEHMEDPDIDDPIEESKGGGGSSAGPSEEAIQSLIDMGFSRAQAKKAMSQTDNNMERAVDWLFSHMDDIPDEAADDGAAGTAAHASAQAASADDVDALPAKYELIGFISHKGTSAHCGHYVAHLRKGDQWVLFNDNKVVEVPDVAKAVGDGYIYIYRRLGA